MKVTCGNNTFCLNLVNIIKTIFLVCFEIEIILWGFDDNVELYELINLKRTLGIIFFFVDYNTI